MTTLMQEDTLKITELAVTGYDKVYRVEDVSVGLLAIISLHDLTLGPGLGGIRMYPYTDFESALTDVKRLSAGMTCKSAAANCGWGGAKSVIIGDPAKKTEELFISLGRAIEQLGGRYIGAEDSGTTPADILTMSKVTKYLTGLPHEKSSGNPSGFTAWGVYRGIQSVLQQIYGSDSVEGRTIAIQGTGSVGAFLADFLFWQGAKLIVTDVSIDRAKAVARKYNAKYCAPEDIFSVECDVFAPCALGGILNIATIPQLRCKAVAGAANNQLLCDEDAVRLRERGILYAPDFVINAGGLINVTEEIAPEGYNPIQARQRTHDIYDHLLEIFAIAKTKECSTYEAAMELVQYRISHKIGLRTVAPCFHHSL